MMQTSIKLLVLLIFIMIAGFFDAGEQIKHLILMNQQEKSLQSELAIRNRVATKPHNQFTLHPKDELIEFFLYQTHKSGLTLKSLSSVRLMQDRMLSINAVLEGGFPEVMSFFGSIERACFPVLINYFTLAMNQDDLSLSLELTLLGVCEKNQTKMVIKNNSSDPFVTSIDDFSEAEKKRRKLLNDFSIKQMRWIGYLQSANEKLAIMMLPDGEAVEVHKGDVIGEHAMVMEIINNQLRVRTK